MKNEMSFLLNKYIDERGEFKEGAITKLVASLLTVIIILTIVGSGIGQVPSGYRGIMLEFGKPVGTIGKDFTSKFP
jgi:regulator of protease activity HflC (stomatin/prohibitin superfamily)